MGALFCTKRHRMHGRKILRRLAPQNDKEGGMPSGSACGNMFFPSAQQSSRAGGPAASQRRALLGTFGGKSTCTALRCTLPAGGATGHPPRCHSEAQGAEESLTRASGGALCKTAAPWAYCEILRFAQNDRRERGGMTGHGRGVRMTGACAGAKKGAPGGRLCSIQNLLYQLHFSNISRIINAGN